MKKRFDAERVLGELARIRAAIPLRGSAPRREKTQRMDARTAEEFELEAVADALEALADDVRLMVETATAEAMEKALDVYYAAEELARDPANTEVAEHVEKMRKAYEDHYKRPIPSKEETEKRRAKGKP
jgi:hypothetical protein